MSIYPLCEDNTGLVTTVFRAGATGVSGGVIMLTSIHSHDPSASTTVNASRYFTQRSSGGTTPTALVPDKANTRAPAPSGTYYRTWGTNPSLLGNPILFQMAGYRRERISHWYAPRPWANIVLTDAEQIDLRSNDSATVNDLTPMFSEGTFVGRHQRFVGRRPVEPGLFHYHNFHRAYCHNTGTAPYDVNRAQDWVWVCRIDTVFRSEKQKNWVTYYGTAAPPPTILARVNFEHHRAGSRAMG